MNRITGGWAVLAIAGAVAVGCGEDEDEGLSKPEYVRQANAICKKFNDQVERQAQRAFAGIRDESDLTPAKARGFFEEALPQYDRQIADLRKLDPPEGDEDKVKRIYDIGEEEGRKIRSALGSDREVRRLVTTDSVTPRFQKASGEYGLDTCSED